MKQRLFFCLVLCLPAAAQSPEALIAAVLGGPCLNEGDSGFAGLHGWRGLVRQHREALQAGDRNSAIEFAKQIVRSRCSNEHWWLRLAEDLAEADRLDESVAALDAFYSQKSNAVDRRLRTPESPVHRLLESDAYQRSALAQKLAADRKALEQRRGEARRKLAALTSRPPDHYVAKPACPGEYCHFGKWTATAETILYDKPAGTRIVARVGANEPVEGVTGEVHLRPLPVSVRYESNYGFTAPAGSIVFLLDYLYEGHGRIWIDGKIVESEITSVFEHCASPAPECWGEFVNPEDEGLQMMGGKWWIQIKTSQGKLGWTREASHFSGWGI
jgi:hypothetical protein